MLPSSRSAAAACVLLLALAAAASAAPAPPAPASRRLLGGQAPAGLVDALGHAAGVGKQAVKQAVKVVDTHLDSAADTLRKAGASLERTTNSFAHADAKVLKSVGKASGASLEAGGKAVGAGLDAAAKVVADFLSGPFDKKTPAKDVAEAAAKAKKAAKVVSSGGQHVAKALGDAATDKIHAAAKGAHTTARAAEKAAVRNVKAKAKGAAAVGKAVDKLFS